MCRELLASRGLLVPRVPLANRVRRASRASWVRVASLASKGLRASPERRVCRELLASRGLLVPRVPLANRVRRARPDRRVCRGSCASTPSKVKRSAPTESEFYTAVAFCEPGDMATGGGYRTVAFGEAAPSILSSASFSGTDWTVEIQADGRSVGSVVAQAMCADLTP